MKTKGVPVFMDGFHGVGNLVGVHLARGAAGDGEILAGDMNGASGDSSAAGDHAIGGQVFVAHAEESAVVLGEEARFLEGVAIQQKGHALPRGKLAALVLLVGALGSAPQFQPVPCCPRDRKSCP